MSSNYPVRRVEKILRELSAYRDSLAYLTALRETGTLAPRAAEATRKKIAYLTLTVTSLEHALERLSPTERTIIETLYFSPEPCFEDLCERCALEKSSVYRYRARALRKIAASMFGE